MSFRDDAQLDPSEVQRPARPRRPRRRIAIGGGGLGVAGIIVIVLLQLLGGGGGLGQLGQLEGATSGTPTGDLADCRTGADANARQDCRILAYVNSVQAFWRQEFERRGQARTCPRRPTSRAASGRPAAARPAPTSARSTARPTSTSTSTWASSTSCATASARPAGRSRRATSSPTSTAITSRICSASSSNGSNDQGATGRSVRTELQADCFAGVWAAHATETGLLEPITQAQIDDALNAAAAVGDDRIQSRRRARSTPDVWTHGSSAQRQRWFTTGLPDRRHDQVRHVRRLDLVRARRPPHPRHGGVLRHRPRGRAALRRRGRARARDRPPRRGAGGARRRAPLRLRPARSGRARGLRGRGRASGWAASTASCTRPAP